MNEWRKVQRNRACQCGLRMRYWVGNYGVMASCKAPGDPWSGLPPSKLCMEHGSNTLDKYLTCAHLGTDLDPPTKPQWAQG
eukprot:14922082-Alexandrium_andersonii.AAC.1